MSQKMGNIEHDMKQKPINHSLGGPKPWLRDSLSTPRAISMSQDFWYIEAMCNEPKNLDIHLQACSNTRPRHLLRTRIFSLTSTYLPRSPTSGLQPHTSTVPP